MASQSKPAPGESESYQDELFFGLVSPIGVDSKRLVKAVDAALSTVGYTSHEISVIELLRGRYPGFDIDSPDMETRYSERIKLGNQFRQDVGAGDALALLAVRHIQSKMRQSRSQPNKQVAYLFRSFKNRDEILAMQRIYGNSYFTISAYSPERERLKDLGRKIANSKGKGKAADFYPNALVLMNTDQDEGISHGQQVRKTYPLADVFVNVSVSDTIEAHVTRFIHSIFGYPFTTPSRDEYGMFHAQAASLRSADLSRQVGAAITTTNGDVIAVGTNEVPHIGGGLYWWGDSPDARDFVKGRNFAHQMRRTILREVISELVSSKAMKEPPGGIDEALIERIAKSLGHAQIMHLNEFGRSVHAEMAALIDAALRGVSVRGGCLYTTTFPCHECTRHIIAAGIDRVLFVEPYAKSYAFELYSDELDIDPERRNTKKLVYQSFVGISPRRYMQFFDMRFLGYTHHRMNEDGTRVEWKAKESTPRFFRASNVYLLLEKEALKRMKRKLDYQSHNSRSRPKKNATKRRK